MAQNNKRKTILLFVQKQELSQSIIIGMNSGPDDNSYHSKPLISKPPKIAHKTQKCQPRWFHHNNPKLNIFLESWNVFVLAQKLDLALRCLQSSRTLKNHPKTICARRWCKAKCFAGKRLEWSKWLGDCAVTVQHVHFSKISLLDFQILQHFTLPLIP